MDAGVLFRTSAYASTIATPSIHDVPSFWADRLIEQIPELVDRINEMISQYRAEKKVDVDLA